MTREISGCIVITHDVGLHARPAVKLTKLAKGFVADIEISSDPQGPWIDAKSIVKVMAMKVKKHSTLYVRASGTDAARAVETLINLVSRDFDEAVVHAAGP